MKRITVRIGRGKVTVTPEGYKGESCKSVSAAIEKALGQVTDDTPTSEMYEAETDAYLEQGEE